MANEVAKPTPGEITAMAGGAVAIICSLLDFVGSGDYGESSWSSGFFPIATLIALFSLAVAVQVALERFANIKGGPGFAGLTWTQVNLMFGFFAVIMVIAWLIVDLSGLDRKIGFWGMAIGAIAVFVGAILMVKERSAAPATPPAPPAA